MTDKEIIKAPENLLFSRNCNIAKNGEQFITLGDILDIINHQQAEIEKLNKYLEVAQNRHKNIRLECADEFVDWLLSLFPKNEDTLIISRPTVLHWYGHQHASFREYLDRTLEGAFEQEREGKRNAKT